MKLTTTQKVIVTLNAFALVCCIIALAGTIPGVFSHRAVTGNNLANEPRVMALAAVGILVLAIGTYLHWLKRGKREKLKARRAIKIVALPVALAVGLGILVVPVLFAPALAPTIWLAFLVLFALLSIALILNPRTRRYFVG